MNSHTLLRILFTSTTLFLLVAADIVVGQNQPFQSAQPKSKMLLIRGGSYIPFSKEAGEKTRIFVKSFLMDPYEVTNADFLKFVKANPEWQKSRVKAIFADANYLRNWDGDLSLGKDANRTSPVTYVSWFAAQAYCKWVAKRLPTTDEWEYALKELRGRKIRTSIAFTKSRRTRDWTEDFNSILLESSKTDDGNSPSILSCGGSSIDVTNPEDYQAFLRYSFRSSLKADYCLANLGFRCAQNVQIKKETK